MFGMPFGLPWGLPPLNPFATPPHASDGQDLYVAKLYARAGIPPDSRFTDSFEKAGVSWKKESKFDKVLKWTGLIFAGALGAVVLQKVFKGKPAAGKPSSGKPSADA